MISKKDLVDDLRLTARGGGTDDEQAADKAAQQVAPSDANQVSCRNVDRPGSRMKNRMCATLAEWSTIQRDRAGAPCGTMWPPQIRPSQ